MNKLISFLVLQILLIPFCLQANDNFSVEIEALTLVMEKYKTEAESESETELEINDKKPSYLSLKQDECNATVKVTEKTGLEIVNIESFDVNVCKREVYKVIN